MTQERLRAYLVDDEPLALDRLARLLRDRPEVEVVGQSTDPEQARSQLTATPPDLLFLDIQMPGKNGFELLATLPEQPIVIFTTAHDEYALRAFQTNAIDYLLKPVDPQQLERALAKVRRLGGKPEWMQRTNLPRVLEELSTSLRAQAAQYPQRIASRLGDRITVLEIAQVTHFFAREKLTYAAVQGQEHSVDESIAELEQKLDPARFLRIHRSVLLNLDWLKTVNLAMPGNAIAVLRDRQNTELPIARDRVRVLKERLAL